MSQIYIYFYNNYAYIQLLIQRNVVIFSGGDGVTVWFLFPSYYTFCCRFRFLVAVVVFALCCCCWCCCFSSYEHKIAVAKTMSPFFPIILLLSFFHNFFFLKGCLRILSTSTFFFLFSELPNNCVRRLSVLLIPLLPVVQIFTFHISICSIEIDLSNSPLTHEFFKYLRAIVLSVDANPKRTSLMEIDVILEYQIYANTTAWEFIPKGCIVNIPLIFISPLVLSRQWFCFVILFWRFHKKNHSTQWPGSRKL